MMKKLLMILVLLTAPTWLIAADIDGDIDTVNDALDISKGGTDAPTAAGARTNLGLGTTDSVTHGVVTAAGAGGLKAGTEGSVRGAITLYSNVNPYAVGINSAATPTGTWTLTLPPGAPAGANYLFNVDADGTGGWTDPSTLGGDDLGAATSSTVIALFGSGSCSGYLKSDGSCDTPSGAAHDAVTLDTETAAIFSLSTQQITLDSQTANYFLAAPNGSAGDPTFRAIADADIPAAIARDSELPNLTAPGAIGGTTPAAGTFTTVTADEILSTCAGTGDCYSKLPNNSSAPSAATVVNGLYTYLNELYGVENSGTASKLLMEKDIDDTPSDGNTSQPASSNSVADHISAADPHTGYLKESSLGTGVETMLGNAPGAEAGPTTTIEAGTSALGTAEIASGACASAVTTAATNAATTDVINWGFNGDPTGVTGYAPTANGMLTIIAYPTSGNVNFKVCNLTAAAITPGAVTLNWRIQR